MLDTIGGEMQKWIHTIKQDGIRLQDPNIISHVFELEYYMIALNHGLSIDEDSGVAAKILADECSEDISRLIDDESMVQSIIKN